ncbi:MAG: hypothetical protein ABIP75_10795, partial [Pyrinomonadaceae bacterium]
GQIYGDYFEEWMQDNIFGVIKPQIRPSCDPAVDFPKANPAIAFARYYDAPVSGDNPRFWSEKQKNYGCHAQGGYYLSMRQLASFMANFQATDTLVSEMVRNLMYNDSDPGARLVWSHVTPSAFTAEHFGVKGIPWHGGDNLGHSAIVQFPGGYIAVGAITGPGNGGDVEAALKDAWGAAVADNF